MFIRDYPDWFGPMLFRPDLPWDDMQKSSLSEFLALYSLHDSNFVVLYIAPEHYAIAVIEWDTIIDEPHFDPPIEGIEYPLLLIFFPMLYEFNMGQDGINIPTTIAQVKSSVLSEEQRLAMLNARLQDPFYEERSSNFLLESSLCRSAFISIGNGPIILTHGESVSFACLDRDKRAYPIPGLTKR